MRPPASAIIAPSLPPRKVEGGGDVAALKGTEVVLHVVPTMKTPGGSILLKDGPTAALTAQADGSLTGSFKIEKAGFYRIELEGPVDQRFDKGLVGDDVGLIFGQRNDRTPAGRGPVQGGHVGLRRNPHGFLGIFPQGGFETAMLHL